MKDFCIPLVLQKEADPGRKSKRYPAIVVCRERLQEDSEDEASLANRKVESGGNIWIVMGEGKRYLGKTATWMLSLR